MAHKISSKSVLAVVATASVLAGVGVYAWQQEHRTPVLEIYVFDLPAGRSMFIRTPQDKRILIDGGGGPDVVGEITKILPFYTRRIDVVIATDALARDVTGLVSVSGRYDIDQAYLPAVTLRMLGLSSTTDQIYSALLDVLEMAGITTDTLKAGDSVGIDNLVNFEVIFPEQAFTFAYSKASAPEVLFRISFGPNSLTFLGNASNKVQKYLALDPASSTDVLVVSHSALPANLAPTLMSQLKPEYLVYAKKVSSNANAITSKKKPVVDPLAYIDVSKRFNLKEQGTIKIVMNGKGVSVEKF